MQSAFAQENTDSRSTSATQTTDLAARDFLMRCAACHTIGGGMLGNAPDLIASTGWSRSDLMAAIKRMEKNVGPLTDQEVVELTDFLKSAAVRQRLAEEQERIVSRAAASAEPGVAGDGKRLFTGVKALLAGGMACAACHRAEGEGGTLAVDLSGVHGRLGEVGLLSAIQGANFPLMQKIYRDHPIAPGETRHLVAYFESIQPPNDGQPAAPVASPVGWLGLGLAAAMLGATVVIFRKRNTGMRRRLVRNALGSRRA